MNEQLKADLQEVANKNAVSFSVTVTVVPVPVTETIDFVPTN